MKIKKFGDESRVTFIKVAESIGVLLFWGVVVEEENIIMDAGDMRVRENVVVVAEAPETRRGGGGGGYRGLSGIHPAHEICDFRPHAVLYLERLEADRVVHKSLEQRDSQIVAVRDLHRIRFWLQLLVITN